MELCAMYERDCKIRRLEKVKTDGYNFACKKFVEFLGYDIHCSELRQEALDDYQLELRERLRAATVNSYLFKISPVVRSGTERGYIKEDIHFSHMVEQEYFKNIYTDATWKHRGSEES